MPARVVLDTNVYVSAYGFGGAPARLLRAAITGEFDLVASPALLAEVARILADKIGFDGEHVEAAVRQIARIADVVRPGQSLTVLADEPDNRVLECAVAGEADTIVSGDRHLLELGEYAGIRVITVAEAISELEGASL
jgi:putative PIN family toxin of toxin-antitoxin system